MFTGIISDIGKVLNIKQNGDLECTIGCGFDIDGIAIGASISHDGICLTVIQKGISTGQQWYKVNISNETVECTNIISPQNSWQIGTLINLERSLKVGDELGGHIVSGHIDGVATVTAIEKIGDSTKISFVGPNRLAKFIATKGSIALNGTSLTINHTQDNNFSINLIPHTQQNTTWGSVKTGDTINVEIDPLARYLARLSEMRG
jgi:riboflavin synthase